MRPYSPGGALNALASARRGSTPPTPSAHRLQLGLPGYLILFAPPAFVPQCQYPSRESSPLRYSSPAVSNAVSPLSSEISHPTYEATYAPFTPSESEQRLPPLYYRGCWHRVSRDFLFWYYQAQGLFAPTRLFPNDRSLQPEGRHPPRGVALSRLRALQMILDCSLP